MTLLIVIPLLSYTDLHAPALGFSMWGELNADLGTV